MLYGDDRHRISISLRFFDFNIFEEDDGPAEATCCFDTLLLFAGISFYFDLMWFWPGRYCFVRLRGNAIRASPQETTHKKAGERVFEIKIRINRQIQKANMTNKKVNKQSELFKRLRSFGAFEGECCWNRRKLCHKL